LENTAATISDVCENGEYRTGRRQPRIRGARERRSRV